MTDPTARAEDTASPAETPKPDQAATEATQAYQAAAQADPTAALAKEAADMKDRLLRTLAEMENLRRRTEREVSDARAYGATAFARDVLAVGDNLSRALQSIDADTRAKADGGLKALLEGVELTERELLKALEKHGVKQIDAQGQKFDPNRHQAMFEIPDPSVPAGTVLQVMQSGYSIGDRVLRPALVGVAKGGPKAAPAGEAPANDNAGA